MRLYADTGNALSLGLAASDQRILSLTAASGPSTRAQALRSGCVAQRDALGKCGELLGANGEDLLALYLDFDAEGRANVAALDDGAANPDVAGAGKIGSDEGIVESVAAGIADERVFGGAVVVTCAKSVDIADVFEFAGTVRGFAREGPIASDRGGRAGREANDGSGNIFAGSQIGNEKIDGGPRLGKIGNLRDHRIGFVGVRQKGIRIGGSGRHFELRSWFDASGLRRPGMRNPAHCQNNHHA